MTGRPSAAEHVAALARLVAHPIRVRIVSALLDHDASASDLAKELDEPVGTVAYHMKLLRDQGALELRSSRQVRGTVERTFALAPTHREDLTELTRWLGRRARSRAKR